jgi:glutamate--cysteine ligase
LDEQRLLAPLVGNLATEKTQADRWLDLYHGAWGGKLDPIYAASSL